LLTQRSGSVADDSLHLARASQADGSPDRLLTQRSGSVADDSLHLAREAGEVGTEGAG
jgi:hypothetical protein